MYFSNEQETSVHRAFERARALTARRFHLEPGAWKKHRHDVRTLARLADHEVDENAFAYLCRYTHPAHAGVEGAAPGHFYRICLQDNRILDALDRGSSFIRLDPLLLYIATHELVHILRFELGETDFDMPRAQRCEEEERVHRITCGILESATVRDMQLVLDCFGSDYRIGEVLPWRVPPGPHPAVSSPEPKREVPG